MSSSLIMALEFGSVIGFVVGLGAWELWRLRKDRQRDGKASDASTRKDSEA